MRAGYERPRRSRRCWPVARTRRPTALVGAIAHAKLETNSHGDGEKPEVSEGNFGLPAVMTRWDLFSAVAQISGPTED